MGKKDKKEKPLVPTCPKCGKPLTQCKCESNDLIK